LVRQAEVCPTPGINTKTPAVRFFFRVMASLAQMARELIVERTRASLQAAKRQGRVEGRKRRKTGGKVRAAKKLVPGGTPRGGNGLKKAS
jgi:DNA invertase Pin-like site-specific DNA recombinase